MVILALLQHLQSALYVSAPLLLILLAGVFFKRINIINAQFVETGNKLIFKVSLPCLLFLSVASRSAEQAIDVALISYAVIATICSVVLVWWLSPLFVEQSKRGVFTQCAFRGNMGIIGLALCINAFGENILALAAIYLAALTITYNVLSVLLLSKTRQGIFKQLAKNPLIIAILLGLLFSNLAIPLPKIFTISLGYLAQLTLPLALVCIGASLEWQSLKANHKESLIATAFKLVILPISTVGIAILFGLRGDALGVLFLMMATPTAAAAYVMSKQMTKHGQLAAEIITLSTLLCPFTVTLGLILLNSLALI